MKKYSSTQLGRMAESYIRDKFKRWTAKGWLPYQNHKAAYCQEGEPFDFTVFKPGKCIAIESKGTQAPVFRHNKRSLTQLNRLAIVEKCGHKGYFFILFVHDKQIARFYPVSVMKANKSISLETKGWLTIDDIST